MTRVDDRAGPAPAPSPRSTPQPPRELRERFAEGLASAQRAASGASGQANSARPNLQGAKTGKGETGVAGLVGGSAQQPSQAGDAPSAHVAAGGKHAAIEQRGPWRPKFLPEEIEVEAPGAAPTTAGASGAHAPEAPPPATAVAQIDPQQAAQLERMAAAIAEARGSADAMLRIDFPSSLSDGSALATGAVLARDVATGALSIRVVGLNPAVGESRRAALETDLRERLDRRRIRISDVTIERGGARAGR